MKKKLLLIVSMLAVAFALAGCGPVKKTVEFEYSDEELAQMTQNKASEYMYYVTVDEFYNFVVQEETPEGISEADKAAVQVFAKLDDECGEFIAFTDEYKKTIKDDKVIMSVYADCANEEAEIRATFVSNLEEYNFQMYMCMAQGYDEASAAEMLASNGVYPYKISEFEIAANQSLSAKMKAAGTNTIIGMGIVFAVLIFISFIISLLKYVPMLFDKETRKARKAEKAKKEADNNVTADDAEASDDVTQRMPDNSIVDIVNTETGVSVMNDAQLVAVISVAVAAYEENTVVNYPSNDKLIARPIRRIKR